MSVNVRIPAPLQEQAAMKNDVLVEAADVRQALTELCSLYPQLRNALFAETGELRSYVNIFLNTEDIRILKNLETPVRKGDIIYILPSIAGG